MNVAVCNTQDKILSIEYPPDGKHRARKVISRSKARPTGKYPSWKMGRMVHWESPHELNAYRLLDANPAVISFHEQPLIIHFILNGEEHPHYPDVLVDFGTTRELWEIKPANAATDLDLLARTRLLQHELSKKGITYHMVTGDELAREPRLSTVLTLLKYGRQQISMVEHEQVRLLFQDDREITWAAAQEVLGHNRSRLLCRLFLEGHLTCDIEQELTSATKFWTTRSPTGL